MGWMKAKINQRGKKGKNKNQNARKYTRINQGVPFDLIFRANRSRNLFPPAPSSTATITTSAKKNASEYIRRTENQQKQDHSFRSFRYARHWGPVIATQRIKFMRTFLCKMYSVQV